MISKSKISDRDLLKGLERDLHLAIYAYRLHRVLETFLFSSLSKHRDLSWALYCSQVETMVICMCRFFDKNSGGGVRQLKVRPDIVEKASVQTFIEEAEKWINFSDLFKLRGQVFAHRAGATHPNSFEMEFKNIDSKMGHLIGLSYKFILPLLDNLGLLSSDDPKNMPELNQKVSEGIRFFQLQVIPILAESKSNA